MLTLAGDGSAKFWEVRQDGTDLTIRYGKMGATGRTQVKAYETAEAATAAAGKLVAEKLRKGYTEDETVAAPEPVGAAGNEPVAAEDEDRLTMPAAWLRALYPRRGGTKVAVKQPDPAAPGQLATRLEGHRQRLLDSLAQVRDPELAAAGDGVPGGGARRHAAGRRGGGRVPGAARPRAGAPDRRGLAGRARSRVRGGGRDRAGLAGTRL
ncbi:hypothetical protein GCM10020220_040300 [Nonomuraea rubra]